MLPSVSVIIPTFQRPQRAVDAAHSALAQTCSASFEVVLVDNDPAGSALDALRAIADPRLVVVHEPLAGVANARNAGLRAARSELIAFLDDEIAPASWLAERRVREAMQPMLYLVGSTAVRPRDPKTISMHSFRAKRIAEGPISMPMAAAAA
jgi:glycosyltransferase involved in cell wall biosynthesis